MNKYKKREKMNIRRRRENYDAGTWTTEEINTIKTGIKGKEVTANGTRTFATEGSQFGGFAAGDWSMYINDSQYAISATALIKTRLDQWYNRYMGVSGAGVYRNETVCRTIYGKKYGSLIDNYTFFYLGSAAPVNPSYTAFMSPSYQQLRTENAGRAVGVRPLIVLSSDAKVAKIPSTKSVTSRGNTYTYKLWTIK